MSSTTSYPLVRPVRVARSDSLRSISSLRRIDIIGVPLYHSHRFGQVGHTKRWAAPLYFTASNHGVPGTCAFLAPSSFISTPMPARSGNGDWKSVVQGRGVDIRGRA